ncbi:hypothetical protein [Paucilactobacillus nenjiangensis]|jgi:hypothetical protein|uniref:Uncharacterized protein n=1 Tax=Paucilactobacillus nenjiangensis TaxID=1296540 RepID=A0A5P1X4K8_9LACO|nr:hypothetical protein [Paucilactobacillus nenjiangensis]QER67218.1 hypothetical protein F0161_04665 [Paucilactobacillus nenjiangensis]
MKKDILFPIILIPLVVFAIIGVITYLKLISGILLIVVWIVGFLLASVGITYVVTQEQLRILKEEDKKKDDE